MLQIHPSQRLDTPSGAVADIDDKMVPLVRAIWALGLETISCCQDFGDGVAGQRAALNHESRYGGSAFIAFYCGYAWLKMPTPDAKRLADLLAETEFRDKVTQRWTPGSWRMHVPLVFRGNLGIELDEAAQIHFPKQQIPRLTSVLESILLCRPTRTSKRGPATNARAERPHLGDRHKP